MEAQAARQRGCLSSRRIFGVSDVKMRRRQSRTRKIRCQGLTESLTWPGRHWVTSALPLCSKPLRHCKSQARRGRGCSGEVETDEHEFNLAILCCLPKKPTGTDPEVGQYFTAEATRPLAIVNTDNRLIASAFRIRWEPALEPWVSHMQRGFLKGRSMIANIVDIDYEAMRVSLKCEEGTIVLFDFQAAFPSISHEYLNTVLRHIGFPPSALSLVAALYDQNRCKISCQGARFTGFKIRAGIREGCPLSPLLFAVVVDLLL